MSEDRAGLSPDDTDDLDLPEDTDDDLPEAGDELDEEGDEPEEAEAEAEERPAAEPPRRESREARTARALRARLKQEREDAQRIRADYDRLLRQTQQPVAPPPDPYRQAELERQEAERVAMMAPHEAAQYYARQAETRLSQTMSRQQVQFGDMLDRQNFASLQRDEPAARRLGSQVEEALIAARNSGMNPTREAIYNLLIGQEVRAKMRRAADTQRRQGRRRVAAQTTRPGAQRSTAAAPRQRSGQEDTEEAIAARLMKVVIGSE